MTQSFCVHSRRLSIQPFTSRKVHPGLRPTSAVVLPSINSACRVRGQQQHAQQQVFCPQRLLQLEQPRKLVSSRASSSDSSSSSGGKPSIWSWFDRLPPHIQLGIMGALLFVGMFVIPFLQPTFMYGDNSSSSSSSKSTPQQQITNVQQAKDSGEQQLYKLPRYIPGASELYDFLQENAMPKKTPDGRNESPGVLRIYLSSMIILALFYACSGLVGLILRSVVAILRAVKIMGPPKPEQ